MTTAKFRDDRFIFLRIDRTGAVNQTTSMAQQREETLHEIDLQLMQPGELPLVDPPPDIDPATHHPGVAAGDVGQNGMKSAAPAQITEPGGRTGREPVGLGNENVSGMEALQILPETPETPERSTSMGTAGSTTSPTRS